MRYPWNEHPLNQWSIVGMNHYFVGGVRHLFVAMKKGPFCIKADPGRKI